jgi:hypothetical protein
VRKTYPPSEVHAMTEQDLWSLIGVYVVVECWATSGERDLYGHRWVGGSGLCDAAFRTESGLSVVVWDYGMQWPWANDTKVYLSVCTGHDVNHDAAHTLDTVAVRACLAQLGVRDNMSLEEAEAKYGR